MSDKTNLFASEETKELKEDLKQEVKVVSSCRACGRVTGSISVSLETIRNQRLMPSECSIGVYAIEGEYKHLCKHCEKLEESYYRCTSCNLPMSTKYFTTIRNSWGLPSSGTCGYCNEKIMFKDDSTEVLQNKLVNLNSIVDDLYELKEKYKGKLGYEVREHITEGVYNINKEESKVREERFRVLKEEGSEIDYNNCSTAVQNYLERIGYTKVLGL